MKKFLTKEQIQIFLDAFEKKIGKKTLLLDMDGVVVLFENTAEKWAFKLGVTVDEFKDKKMYRDIPEFYLELELMPGAKESIMRLDEFYDIIFVSAPSWGNINSFSAKRIWMEENFGEWGEKRMDLSFHKGHYMGHYLVDDRTKYGAGDFIGEHIMYGTEPFKNWKEVEEYLLQEHINSKKNTPKANRAEKGLTVEKIDKAYRYAFSEISNKTPKKNKTNNFVSRLINKYFYNFSCKEQNKP